MTTRTGFAERLRAAIDQSGLSQAEVARRAKISGASLTLWVRGDSDPANIRATNIHEVARVLSTTPEWLLHGHHAAVMDAGGAYGTDQLGRIISWSDPSELPAGRFVVLPRLAAFLSAGNGGTMDGEPEAHANGQAFRSDFIAKMGWRVDTHYTLRVRGDSMSPTIPEGSAVVIDVSRKDVEAGAIYAVRIGTDVRLKRLQVLPNGLIRVSSDNPSPAYAPIDARAEDLVIVGRAVHLSTLL